MMSFMAYPAIGVDPMVSYPMAIGIWCNYFNYCPEVKITRESGVLSTAEKIFGEKGA